MCALETLALQRRAEAARGGNKELQLYFLPSRRRSLLNEKVASAPLLPRLLFQGQNSRCDANCSCQRGHKFIADDFSCGSSGRSQTKAGCKLVSSRPALMSAEIVKSSFKVTQDACYYSFDKRTPLKLPGGGGGLRRFPLKEQARHVTHPREQRQTTPSGCAS